MIHIVVLVAPMVHENIKVFNNLSDAQSHKDALNASVDSELSDDRYIIESFTIN